MKTHQSESVRAIVGKLIRDIRLENKGVFERSIEPFLASIDRAIFINSSPGSSGGSMISKIEARLLEYGEAEFIIICRAALSVKVPWLHNLKNVSLQKKKMEEIEKIY